MPSKFSARESEFRIFATARVKFAGAEKHLWLLWVSERRAEWFDTSFSVSFRNKLRPRYVARRTHSLFILIFDSHLNICSCGCHTEVIGLAKIDGDGRRLNLQPAAAAVGFGQGTSLSHICTLNHWKNIFKTDLIIGEFTALDFFFKSLKSRKKKCLSINNRVVGIIWVYIDPNLWQDFKKFSGNCKKEQQKIKQVSS